ncbi:MAG: GNAT family N-acetyltransferase [Acidimicrobiales bacterium]
MPVGSLGFLTDLQIRRLAGASIEDRGDRIVVRTTARPTYHWGNFVVVPDPQGRAEPSRWRAMFEEAHPGAAHVAIGVDATAEDGALGPAAQEAGLVLDVSTVLVADRLSPPAHPNVDATYKVLEDDGDWVGAAALRAAVAHGDGRATAADARFLERSLTEMRNLSRAGHAVYLGACAGGEVLACLGIVAAGAGRLRYQQVETHPAHRRRGLAGSLLHAAAAEGATRWPRAHQLVIVADPAGPAISLYRSLGFADAGQHLELSAAPPA